MALFNRSGQILLYSMGLFHIGFCRSGSCLLQSLTQGRLPSLLAFYQNKDQGTQHLHPTTEEHQAPFLCFSSTGYYAHAQQSRHGRGVIPHMDLTVREPHPLQMFTSAKDISIFLALLLFFFFLCYFLPLHGFLS